MGVALDHPFPPEAPAAEKAARIQTTLRNTERMLRALQEWSATMELLPVVHGHTPAEVRDCLDRLTRLLDACGAGPLRRVGIGSLAPAARNGRPQVAIEVIRTVRAHLPTAHIHCFSMGSALLMLLAFYAGADTVDSQSWIVSAGFKLAQLPGHYVVRMARREYRSTEAFNEAMNLFAERLRWLAETEGFFTKNWQTGEVLDLRSPSVCRQYVETLVDWQSNENVHNRACHNLWVYNFEVRRARQAMAEGRFEQFLESRLAHTRYYRALLAARTGRESHG